MKLDNRIIEGKKPLTAFDEMESKFIGTSCYFSDNASDYGDLSNCQIGCLSSRDGKTGVFNAMKNNSYAFFIYCLPCEWVQEQKEPKWRAFKDHAEYKEFLNDGVIENWVKIKNKTTNEIYELMYVGGGGDKIILGGMIFSVSRLFRDFELFNECAREWQPFGVYE